MIASDPQQVTTIKTRILSWLAANKEALFTDFEDDVEGFAGDDVSYCPQGMGEVYYWPAVSINGAEALKQLREEGKVFFEPEQPFLYFVDGKVPPDPIATYAGCRRGYKKLRWLPIAICGKPRKPQPA
jgi:hypothetical protein